MKQSLYLLVFLIIATGLRAQTFDRAKMDAFFDHLAANEQAMGSISISKDGKEIYQRAIGYAEAATEQAADAETAYRVGSISKTFTATIIMQLVEEGKLRLGTKLSDYFPQVPNAKKITVEQLLRHRSGIFNFTSAEDYEATMEDAISREDLAAKIASYPSAFPPDSTADYSNSGYVLLTYIAEQVTGREFAELLQKRICKPCGLTRTAYGGKISPAANEALSYTAVGEWELASETDMSVPAGAGAVIATPTDLTRFFNCLFTGKLIKETSLNRMTKLVDDMGMGLFQFPFGEKKAFGHTGGIDGFQSMAGYFPKERLAIAYVGNGIKYTVNDIMIGALSIYFGADYKLPEFTEAVELTSEQLDRYTGTYSSPTFPLKIMVRNEEGTLTAQATGQSAFPLEAEKLDHFRFNAAGIKIEFVPEKGTLILRQAGGEYELTREK